MAAEMYLMEFFEKHYRPLRLRGMSDNTLRHYAVDLKHFKAFLNRPPMVRDLTSLTISQFLEWFAKTPWRGKEKRSPYTVEKARCQLLALARYAFKKRLLEEEPEVNPGRLPTRVPRAYTQIEMQNLLTSCRQAEGQILYIDAPAYWVSLVLVLFDTAERIGAIRDAEWSWVDLDGGWLSVPAEYRKGKTADRVYRLAPDTIAALRKIQEDDRRLIWPWSLHRGQLFFYYQRILKRAGLYVFRQAFHAIRRTTASHYEAAGGNATELLDHSSRALTKRSYIDPRIADRRHATDLLFRPKDEHRPAG